MGYCALLIRLSFVVEAIKDHRSDFEDVGDRTFLQQSRVTR